MVDRVLPPPPIQPLRGAAQAEHAEEFVRLSVDTGGDTGQAFLLLVDGEGVPLLTDAPQLRAQHLGGRDRRGREPLQRLAEEPLETLLVVAGQEHLATRTGVQRETLTHPAPWA